jgi:OmpA-OmpF porin, OOP family
MNARAIIVLLVFAGWSGGSWYWYACKIKQKCSDTPPTASAVIDTVTNLPQDTLVSEVPIAKDTVVVPTAPESVVKTDSMVTLHFQTNATQFDSDEKINNYLTELAKELGNGRVDGVTIVGHTDDVGGEAVNQKLSLARAKDVKAVLVKKGAPTDKIAVDGKGESLPIEVGETEEIRFKNRRVEIIFKK